MIRFPLLLLLTSLITLAAFEQSSAQQRLTDNFTDALIFQNLQINSIATDSRGLVYFGTSRGIIEYDGVEWREIDFPGNSAVYKLRVNEQGRIFAGGRGEFGYLFVDDAGNTRYSSLTQQFSITEKNRIVDILIDGSRLYFISTEQIYLYANSQVSEVSVSGKFTAAEIFNGNLYVLDQERGLLLLSENNEFKSVAAGKNLRGNILKNLSDRHLLVITSSRGIYLVDKNNGTHTTSEWGNDNPAFFTENRISSAVWIDNTALIFGSFNNGLLIMDHQGKTIRHFTDEDGLINNLIFDIQLTRRNTLWAGSFQGASLIRLPAIIPELQTRTEAPRTVDEMDTLSAETEAAPDPSSWQAFKNAANQLFSHLLFWRDEKVETTITYDPADFSSIIRRVEYIRTDSLIFGGAFTREAFGVQVLQQADTVEYVFPHSMNEFRFSYASNQFENLDDIEFQVMLEGLDLDWSLWTSNTFREYTNLNWGNFTFRVRARDIHSEVSTEAAFSFSIKPPWYEAIWFFVLQIAILFGFIVISFFLNKSGKALGVSETLISIVVIISFKYLTLYISPFLFQYSQGIAIFHIGISILLGLSLKPVEGGFRWTLNKLTGYTPEELRQIQQDYQDRKTDRVEEKKSA